VDGERDRDQRAIHENGPGVGVIDPRATLLEVDDEGEDRGQEAEGDEEEGAPAS
jgi:hypothetical protein